MTLSRRHADLRAHCDKLAGAVDDTLVLEIRELNTLIDQAIEEARSIGRDEATCYSHHVEDGGYVEVWAVQEAMEAGHDLHEPGLGVLWRSCQQQPCRTVALLDGAVAW